jgi:hypothetical protein
VHGGESVTTQNKCCCCGGTFECEYEDEFSKIMAESCDVCPQCLQADCRVLTGETCNVTGKQQAQLVRG